MYGVVIWSDEDEQKAVIWCEDHGDLAFYRQADGDGRLSLDAGDWVQFDLTMEQQMRYALNPRLVAEGVYSELADSLAAPRGARPGQGRPSRKPRASARCDSAQVIPFAAAKGSKNAAKTARARNAC